MKYSQLNCIFISIVMLAVSGCSSVALKVANIPANFFDGDVQKDLVFDQAQNLKLDVYIPKQDEMAPLPVIVFFYGGRWSFGEKHQYQFVATALANKGFIVVVPDYRKYPQVQFPAFVEDGALALQWTFNNIQQYNGQKNNIFVSGHSAGAHIGALLVSDAGYLMAVDSPDAYKAIKGFAGLAGPYSFTPKEEDLVEIFGPSSQFPQMQVPTFIKGVEPPLLLLTGAKDTTVESSNAERLAQAVRSKGGSVETKVYKDIDHTQIIGVFSTFLESKAPVVDDVTAFFKDQL